MSERSEKPILVENTKFGFWWGPMLVERTCSDEKWGAIVSIKGAREVVEIRVTPSGSVRVGTKRKTLKGERER